MLHHEIWLRGPMGTLPHRDREVTDLGLYELQRSDHPLLGSCLRLKSLDEFAKLALELSAPLKELIGPGDNLGPALKLRELHPAIGGVVRRRHRLGIDAGHGLFLEHEPTHAAADAFLRHQRLALRIANKAPGDVSADGIAQHDPSPRGWIALIPAGGLDELAAEHGVLPLHGVLVFKRIADAQITYENGCGDLAAVHSLLKPGLALQEAHRRRVRPVEGFGSAQEANGVQLH